MQEDRATPSNRNRKTSQEDRWGRDSLGRTNNDEMKSIQLIGHQIKHPVLSRFTLPISDLQHDLVPQSMGGKSVLSPIKDNSDIREEKSKISSKELSSPGKDPLSSPPGANRRTLERIRTKSSQYLSEFAAPDMLIPKPSEVSPIHEHEAEGVYRQKNQFSIKKDSRFSFERVIPDRHPQTERLPSVKGSRTSITHNGRERYNSQASVEPQEGSKVEQSRHTNNHPLTERDRLNVRQFEDIKYRLKRKPNASKNTLDRLTGGELNLNKLDLEKVHQLIDELKANHSTKDPKRRGKDFKQLAYNAQLSVQILDLLAR